MAMLSQPVIPHSKSMEVVTYHMHGFNQGRPLLEHICSSLTPDIILLQEHWLTPCNFSDVLCFSPEYIGYGISAMEKALENRILIGRPYGGTAI